MRARAGLLTLALCLVTAAAAYAADPFTGTWKLNEAKSKIPTGATKNTTVVYESVGDSVKVTIDGVDKDGKATHNEWTGKYDGKDYPVTGNPAEDSRAITKIDEHTLAGSIKKDGKVTITARIVVSADGKTRTVTTHSTDAKGNKLTAVSVYDKQ